MAADPRIDYTRPRPVSLAPVAPDQATHLDGLCAAWVAAVGAEFACQAITDPATNLITISVNTYFGHGRHEVLAHLGYAVENVNQFDDLAGPPALVGELKRDIRRQLKSRGRCHQLGGEPSLVVG